MKLLNEYFKLQKEIYEYFGYIEDWAVIPLEDSTEYLWFIRDEMIIFAETKENLLDGYNGDFYKNEIYTQRFLPKWVYRGKDYTMICVNTRTDGNKFLQVFDNNKELKEIPDGEYY